MTSNHRDQLIWFVLRTGMYIQPVDEHNINSFLSGFEVCAKGKCSFTQLLRERLEDKYKIRYAERGLTQQIQKLAKKRNDTWVTTFRKVAMEILTLDGDILSRRIKKYLKYIVDLQVDLIGQRGSEFPSQPQVNLWLAFVFLRTTWAKEMWSSEEWKSIKQIDTQVRKAYSSKVA